MIRYMRVRAWNRSYDYYDISIDQAWRIATAFYVWREGEYRKPRVQMWK